MAKYRHRPEQVLHHDDQRAEIEFAINRAVVRLKNAVLGEFEIQFQEAELEGRIEEYKLTRAEIYKLMESAILRLSGRALSSSDE